MIEPWIISTDTLHPSHLKKAFKDTLRYLLDTPPAEIPLVDLSTRARAESLLAERVLPEEDLEYLEDLADILNRFAPEGYYFGAHEFEEDVFGFFPYESDDRRALPLIF